MTSFSSTPPSRRDDSLTGFFQGGMMPATDQRDLTAILLIDLRALNLSTKMGTELERKVRDFIHAELKAMNVDVSDRSAIDLSRSVVGYAVE